MIKKHTGDIVSYLNPETRAAVKSLTEKQYDVTMIDAHKIYVNEKNFYGLRGVEEMANSMAVSDNIPPLVVAPAKNGRYKLISGERRLSAVLLRESRGEIEHPKVPCFVREIQPIGPLSIEQSETFLMIIENAHRDKTPLEKLHEIQAMEPIARTIYDDAYSKGDVKGRFRTFFAENILNMTESALTRLKSLEHLIPAAEEALEDGRIGLSLAVELSKSSEEAQQHYMELFEKGEVQGTLQELRPRENHTAKSNEEEKQELQSITEKFKKEVNKSPSAYKGTLKDMVEEQAEPLQESQEEPEPSQNNTSLTAQHWSEVLVGIPKKFKTSIIIMYIEYMGAYGAALDYECRLPNRYHCHTHPFPDESDAVFQTKEEARDAALAAYMDDDDFREALAAAGYLPQVEPEGKEVKEEQRTPTGLKQKTIRGQEKQNDDSNGEDRKHSDNNGKPQAGEKTKEQAAGVVNEQFSDKEQAAPADNNDTWTHEWTMVNSAIAEELRGRIATVQNHARRSENTSIVLYYNRLAAVYGHLLDEFLEAAIDEAISLEVTGWSSQMKNNNGIDEE